MENKKINYSWLVVPFVMMIGFVSLSCNQKKTQYNESVFSRKDAISDRKQISAKFHGIDKRLRCFKYYGDYLCVSTSINQSDEYGIDTLYYFHHIGAYYIFAFYSSPGPQTGLIGVIKNGNCKLYDCLYFKDIRQYESENKLIINVNDSITQFGWLIRGQSTIIFDKNSNKLSYNYRILSKKINSNYHTQEQNPK